jgi:hypothetical protein
MRAFLGRPDCVAVLLFIVNFMKPKTCQIALYSTIAIIGIIYSALSLNRKKLLQQRENILIGLKWRLTVIVWVGWKREAVAATMFAVFFIVPCTAESNRGKAL